MPCLRKIAYLLILPFFGLVDSRRYDIMRMALAVASMANSIDIWSVRHTIFSDSGMIANYLNKNHLIYSLSIFYIPGAQSDEAVTIFFILSMLFSITLFFGFFSRVSAIATYVWIMSTFNHLPPIACGYEVILVTFSLIMLLSPLSGTWSIDGQIQQRKSKTIHCRLAPSYGIFLLQWQVFLIYFSTALYKILKPSWQNGETVFYYLSSFYGRFSPEALWPYRELLFILSDLTIIIEFTLPFLLWNKKTRWLGLFIGIGFHLSIGALSRLSIFSVVIIATYSSFLDSYDLNRLIFWKRGGNK
jgi:hypothetical protein